MGLGLIYGATFGFGGNMWLSGLHINLFSSWMSAQFGLASGVVAAH